MTDTYVRDARAAPGRAIGALIGGFFGSLWAIGAALTLPAPLSAGVVIAALAVFGLLAWAAASDLRRQPGAAGGAAELFRSPLYIAAVVGEVVLIPLGARLLTMAGYPEYIVAMVAAVVGLHFFVIAAAFRLRIFSWVGLAMVALAALVVLVLPQDAALGGAALNVWQLAIGLGCALILWAAAALGLRS